MIGNKDINKYGETRTRTSTAAADDAFAVSAGATAKSLGSMVWKLFLTIFTILTIAGFIVLFTVGKFVWSMRNTEIASLSTFKLSESSRVLVDDEFGNPKEYMKFYAYENRTWVDFAQIPDAMKNAMVAIEDKRFYDHNGVDWRTTVGAAVKLATGQGGAGGSTLTQQLIKNITKDDEVSITRKLREIFTALNLEKKYSKDEILEYYLNYVYFGSGCNGIQAAAKTYFGKDIWDCSIAECASIAGITQNPYAYTPMIFPENNKDRQQIVLGEMYSQGYITKEEYDDAMLESENMNWAFSFHSSTGEYDAEEEDDDENGVWNWYIENMYYEMVEAISEEMNISTSYAANMVNNGGLEIYSCLNEGIQSGIEKVFTSKSYDLIDDPSIQFGFFMMDYSGKELAVVGSRYTKNANLLTNRATQTTRQAGSSFKGISVYPAALDNGTITYGTVVKDQPIEGYFDDGQPGPNNFDGLFQGYLNVDQALEISQNAPAAQICKALTPQYCYNFLTQRLHFTTLDPAIDQYSLSALAIGGLYNGVTVKEMTAAYQIYGNGGNYYKPYSFYYIKDSMGEIIVDNRNKVPSRALSEENATIMNRLLQNVVYGYNATASQVQIPGWTIYGKTGTTDDFSDTWFVGGTPFAVAGCWAGYDMPSTLPLSTAAKTMWRVSMEWMIDNYGYNYPTDFTYSDYVEQEYFCRDSGLIASYACYNMAVGYYSTSNKPAVCNAGTDHTKYNRVATYSAVTTPDPVLEPEDDAVIPAEDDSSVSDDSWDDNGGDTYIEPDTDYDYGDGDDDDIYVEPDYDEPTYDYDYDYGDGDFFE
ncbi:MAG: transglycosylase domain-containing protein [Clostridia bacterium]|nr:transglycosylase domain-containing protein [Clostridia bacterium]